MDAAWKVSLQSQLEKSIQFNAAERTEIQLSIQWNAHP